MTLELPYKGIQRGNCQWCGGYIGLYDYWFPYIRRFHRACKDWMIQHESKARVAPGDWPTALKQQDEMMKEDTP